MKQPHLKSTCAKVFAVFLLFFVFCATPTAFANSIKRQAVKASVTGEYGEYIVKVRENASAMAVQKMATANGVSVLGEKRNHLLIKLNKTTGQNALSLLAADPAIEYIEPNIRVKKSSDILDPGYPDQWGLQEIDAPEAWNKVTGKSEVIVAVIDTGVDYTHPDLADRVDTENDFDYVNFDDDAMDDEGHGTHVAGIIAAEANDLGIVGVAGKANIKILPIKVLDETGEGNMYFTAMAVMDAADQGAKVINLSLGGKGHSIAMEEAVEYAIEKGAVVIVAAGNESDDADLYTPASIPDVITVSAVDQDLHKAYFSNYGSSIDVAAPGVGIVSTYLDGGYATAAGTSQATPFVSGIAALLKVQHPDLTVVELTKRVKETAVDLGATGRDDLFGQGLVNAYLAVTYTPPAKQLSKLVASPTKLSLKPEGTQQISLYAIYQDNSQADVTAQAVWTSSNPGVASVKNGLVTAHTFGTATISATYSGKKVDIPVTTVAIKSLQANKSTIPLKPNGTAEVQLTAVLADGSKVSVDGKAAEWASQNEAVATVADGKITAKGFGKTYVTATYGAKTVKITVDVKLVRLEADPKKLSMKPDGVAEIKLTAVYGDKSTETVTALAEWKSQDDKVASVSGGVVTAKNFGKTNITATYGGKTVKIPVEIKLTKLVAAPGKLSMKPDGTASIKLTAVYGNEEEDVTAEAEWKSSNTEVATVNEDGVVTAHNFGKADITATYRGKSVKIPVEIKLTKLIATPKKVSMKPDDTQNITLIAVYGNEEEDVTAEAEWKSSNAEVATVNEDGVVTAHNFGKADITATYRGKSIKIPVEIKLRKLTAEPGKFYLKPGDSKEIVITADYGDVKDQVTDEAEWQSSNADVAVYEDGEVVAKGFGKATLTATYRGKSVKISVDTTLKKLVVDNSRITLKLSGDQSFTPTLKATYRNDVTDEVTEDVEWISSNSEIATVDENGQITAKAKGKATITAKYGGKSVKISVTVTE